MNFDMKKESFFVFLENEKCINAEKNTLNFLTKLIINDLKSKTFLEKGE